MAQIYDPVKFMNEVGLFTMAFVVSFVTWKLLNALYDNLYEPSIENIICTNSTDKYYLKIGKQYIQLNIVFKEIIKWIIVIIFLMLLYNIIKKIEERINKKI